MKRKNISNELKCKIKVSTKKETGSRTITAHCTSRNEILINVGY